MINIRLSAIKKCYNTLSNCKHNGNELKNLLYLVTQLLQYCTINELDDVDVNDNMLANLLLVFDDELNDIKLNYVNNKIGCKRFKLLPSNISFGIACSVPGDTTLMTNGYEQGFIYMAAGSSIRSHKHTDTIEIYNKLDGNMKVFNDYQDINICGINNNHEIDKVDRLTIVETFKIRRDLLNDEKTKNTSKVLIKK